MSITSTYDFSKTNRQAPERKTVGRFKESPQIKLVRTVFKAMSVLTPGISARIGYRLLCTPPSGHERSWQRELRERASTSQLSYADEQLRLYEWGTGPTVLMVHGWGACATHMGRMIDPLVKAGYRVVAFDAPAHGHSTGSTVDPIQFAGAIHAVANHIGDIHTLIAHSFGVAMALLARRDWSLEAHKQVYISGINHCKWITDMFANYSGASDKVIERMQQIMIERYSGRFIWDQLSVVEMLRRTKEATLLIHDQDDGEIPFEHSVALHKAARMSDLQLTKGLGHHRLLGDAAVIQSVVDFVSTTQNDLAHLSHYRDKGSA